MLTDQLHPCTGKNSDICLSKKKVGRSTGCDATRTLSRLVRSRILIDRNYYKSMCDVEAFKTVWCCGELVCWVYDDELCFAPEVS